MSSVFRVNTIPLLIIVYSAEKSLQLARFSGITAVTLRPRLAIRRLPER